MERKEIYQCFISVTTEVLVQIGNDQSQRNIHYSHNNE